MREILLTGVPIHLAKGYALYIKNIPQYILNDNFLKINHLIIYFQNAKCHGGNNQLMMVPIVSSSPGGGGIGSSRGMNSVPPVRIPEIGRQQRPILPKPYPHMLDPINVIREGRNGPILDVKSIIADYR
jgi:hypothetical protein